MRRWQRSTATPPSSSRCARIGTPAASPGIGGLIDWLPCAHVQVDVDELGGLAAELGISSMPTFLFYKSGEIIHTMRGADEAKLREKVAELV